MPKTIGNQRGQVTKLGYDIILALLTK